MPTIGTTQIMSNGSTWYYDGNQYVPYDIFKTKYPTYTSPTSTTSPTTSTTTSPTYTITSPTSIGIEPVYAYPTTGGTSQPVDTSFDPNLTPYSPSTTTFTESGTQTTQNP